MQRSNQAQSFREMCERHGLAVTHQRQIIFGTLAGMRGHPSPEAVYDLVKEHIPSISLATVYKNLKTFEEHGLDPRSESASRVGAIRNECGSAPSPRLSAL